MGAYNCILAEPDFDFIHFVLFPALPNSDDKRTFIWELKCDASRESMMLSSPLKRIVEEATIQYTSTIHSIRGTRLLESWRTVSFQLYGLQMTNCEFLLSAHYP